jgi:hypothetical protein
MDARIAKTALLAAALLSCGANWRSENFVVVSAPSDELAQEIATYAERYRRELAIQWLGRELPKWQDPCPISAGIGARTPSSGKTTFIPTGGVPYGWQMEVYGTRERVLDSVLPHEILHTVFASHFGVPLPRWADEGACTTVEHHSEKAKQEANLIHYLKNERGIAFNKMFAMKEYPRDMLPLYAQGYSLARFLIAHGGERKFVDFIGDGLKQRSWTQATQRHYGYESLADLQTTWLAWVKQGSPPISRHAEPTREELANSDPTSIQSQLGRIRGGNALETDTRPAPTPPTSFASAPRDETTSVSRPASGGWYKRQRQQAEGLSETASSPAADAGPVVRGQQPDEALPPAPPPEHQGNAAETAPVPSRDLVPLKRRAEMASVTPTAPVASRKVLLQWTRPKDQPWAGGPVAEVALRSEPRNNRSLPVRGPEYFDAPLASDRTLWR